MEAEKIRPFNPKKEINDASDYEDYARECVLEPFLETFTKENGLIRDFDDNIDSFGNELNWTFVYTTRGHRLAERMIDRLIKLGEKHFPEDDIDISTHLFQEA